MVGPSDSKQVSLVTDRERGPAYWFFGTLWVILVDVHQSGGSFSVIEQWMRGGVGPGPHVHAVDEWFYVIEGTMELELGDRAVSGSAGDSIWIPRHTNHAFKTGPDGAHVLNGYVPGGVEQIIAGLATPAERRELPPEDFPLPSEEVLVKMNNNFWTSGTENAWSDTPPRS